MAAFSAQHTPQGTKEPSSTGNQSADLYNGYSDKVQDMYPQAHH